MYNTPAPYAPSYLITRRNQLYGQPMITSSNFGSAAQNLNLAYGPRTLQFAGGFEF